jgi:hypothetical protein
MAAVIFNMGEDFFKILYMLLISFFHTQ